MELDNEELSRKRKIENSKTDAERSASYNVFGVKNTEYRNSRGRWAYGPKTPGIDFVSHRPALEALDKAEEHQEQMVLNIVERNSKLFL